MSVLRFAKRSGWFCGALLIVIGACLLAFHEESMGAQPLPPDIGDQQTQRQREADRQRLRDIQDAQPDVRLQPEDAAKKQLEYPSDEKPCFLIREIVLEGDRTDKFQWLLKPVRDALGRCLGGKGINIVMSRMQSALLAKGYATTRVVAPPQDLKSGVLRVKLLPGVVGEVALSKDSGRYTHLYPMMPLRQGKLLNVHDVEQGLENLRRVPSVTTDIKLMPGKNEGESKVEILRKMGRPVRVMLSADDAGSRYTGKYQGTATLSLDNMLGMSDLFYASIGANLEQGKQYGTGNYSFYYSIPWTYWQLTLFHNKHDYEQRVAGYVTDYLYSGKNRNTSIELSRVVHRTAKSKTSLFAAGFMNESSNYIDDTELEIQRRRLVGWEAGISHRQFIGSAHWRPKTTRTMTTG